MTAEFTKLRGVRIDQLPHVVAQLSNDERDHLECGYLDVAALAVLDHLYPLGIAGDLDAVALLCHLNCLLERNPEV